MADLHIHIHHHFEGAFELALSPSFQAQIDRLTTFFANNKPVVDTGPTVDAEDEAALQAVLDTNDVPAAAAPVVNPAEAPVATAEPGAQAPAS